MTSIKINRRRLLGTGTALGATTLFAPSLLRAATPLKVAGIHASPVDNTWNSVLHAAMLAAHEDGSIEYTFS
ncbi:MAG: BMP family ABC transporter substrate-binding protein, partial [Pseudomonadota bacterium]|nr:BMP family ABC transporter substrate-binding protein [Pseudomonadota bacterium]